MRNLYLSFLLFFGFSFVANAQLRSNDWISFSNSQQYSLQQYFRIKIWKEGIYRVEYADLQNAGVPVTSWFSPNRYQIFNNGTEQRIAIADNDNNGIFNNGDYIEFYGNKTNGQFDTQLYNNANEQPNKYLSLFNDTASYFLTYNTLSTNNKRMLIETDQNFAAYPVASYLIDEQIKSEAQNYNIGPRDGNSIAENSYMAGEGWYYNPIQIGSNVSYSFNVSNYLSNAIVPTFEYSVMGANANAHPYTIKCNSAAVDSFYFYGYFLDQRSLNVKTYLQNGQVQFSVVADNDPSNPNNRNYINTGFLKLTYGRGLDFTNESFPKSFSLGSFGVKATYNLSNTNLTNARIYLIHGDTVRYIQHVNNGGNIDVVIPDVNSNGKLYVIEGNQVLGVSGNAVIEGVNNDPDPNKNARFTNYLYNSGTNNFLIVSHRSLWSSASDYVTYRNQKGFSTLLADIDELYDQFAWGIKRHPMSIRNFSDLLLDSALVKPEYLLLLGKGILYDNARTGLGYQMNLVPTYGEPASDNMFTSHLNGSSYVPEIATGRVAAQNDSDVVAYLNKLIEFESNQNQQPQAWMKNVLHFGGGSTLDEQYTLATKLNAYKLVIEDTLFGGTVTTFLKSSNNPIQINQSQFLQALIDSGCSMMTFYGHAAGTSFDISTDAPENYNNQGRYPVVLAQSCFVGDIYSTSRLLNERFVLTPNKAAIAFMAVPDKGIIDELDAYSTEFHNQLFRENYGKSISKCMDSTIASILAINPFYKNVCMNMCLHGDPAITMNSYTLADYAVEDAGISFEPKLVTTEMDSFVVKIAVANLGMNSNASMRILLSRTMPDGISKRDTIIQVPYVTFIDTFAIKLPVDFKSGSGLNKFDITVDVFNEVDEWNEFSNNIAHSTLMINSTDINPVFPQEFAIIPNPSPSLKATTANLFATPKNYRFELDTTIAFNSPFKKTGLVTNGFGILTWQLPLVLDSNEVYYWRVANDSIVNPDTAISNLFQWKSSSFMYKPNTTGWSQADFPQFMQSTPTNIILKDTTRYFDFIDANFSLTMKHHLNVPSYDINGANMDYGGCTGAPQIAVAVLDSIEFEKPWQTDSCLRYFGNYNYFNCTTQMGCNRQRPDKFFLFNTAVPDQKASLIDMIENKVPDGNYLLSWTVFPVPFDTMLSVKNAFVGLGAAQYSTLTVADKYLFFMKKGDPSSVIFKKGVYPTEDLTIDYNLIRNWDKGYVASSMIGPATSWSSVHWNWASADTAIANDSITLNVYGITQTGIEVLLIDSVASTQLDFSISNIDATIFPYLKLKLYTQDLISRTPAQLTKWQVYYEPVPEGALNTKYYSFYNDTVQEGENVVLSMAFENISSVTMDSLLVDLYLYNKDNVRFNIQTKRLSKILAPGDTVMASFTFNTLGFENNNVLWIEANPRNDQPEQYHFNNLASIPFYVSTDKINPLLDVTFDGIHILNGDIVSSKPMIEMQLLDENKFIALNDTSNFRISLTKPNGSIGYLSFESSPSSSTNIELLKWVPAQLPKNSFKISYNPSLLEDGTYLINVEAKDESGNLSGMIDYKIQFEIVNKSTITEVVNYPNPFSTSTRFVFVLTGSEVPTDFSIQIMTISGKVVREISKQEIGNIRIGRNITEYAWDGKDQFGDQLANGVYLYRVRTAILGNEIEKRETSIDQYFKRGWGKMYLLR